MPLNESSAIPRSNLTRKQQREAEAAIYGLPTEQMDHEQFSHEEIERMRAILAQHDRSSGRPETIDLNNPKTPPYRYQKFPKVIYHHGKREHRIVRSEDELEGFLELGWVDEPYPAEPPAEPELDAASAAEVARINDQLAEMRKKKSKKQDQE